YHERNIFFDQGEVSAVIDWEQALFAPRGWELLRTLVFVWDLALAESVAFLEAYQQVYPLPLTELDLAARWFAWSRGHNLWVYQAVYLEGNQRARPLIGAGGFAPLEPRWARIYSAITGVRGRATPSG
ncbi:MAG: phosphotransferase, partial [Chloroflexales bacterium]|nr:phosphotransferase [Chloroflexales bacterium]